MLPRLPCYPAWRQALDRFGCLSHGLHGSLRNRDCCVAAGAGAAMNWLLYTKATAAEAGFSCKRLELFRFATAGKRSRTAANWVLSISCAPARLLGPAASVVLHIP